MEETLTITPMTPEQGGGWRIEVKHSEGTTWEIPISNSHYEQLRRHFVPGLPSDEEIETAAKEYEKEFPDDVVANPYDIFWDGATFMKLYPTQKPLK